MIAVTIFARLVQRWVQAASWAGLPAPTGRSGVLEVATGVEQRIEALTAFRRRTGQLPTAPAYARWAPRNGHLERRAEQTRRHAQPTATLVVGGCEIVVEEQLAAFRRQVGVQAVPTCVVEVDLVAIKRDWPAGPALQASPAPTRAAMISWMLAGAPIVSPHATISRTFRLDPWVMGCEGIE